MFIQFAYLFLLAFMSPKAEQLIPQEDVNLTGQWEGVFTQDENGETTEFKAEMILTQKGKDIKGHSFVYADSLHAEMILEGKIKKGRLFTFQETKIVRKEKRRYMEWCLKKGELLLSKDGDTWILNGLWEGKTSFSNCTPGRVYLKKVPPRV